MSKFIFIDFVFSEEQEFQFESQDITAQMELGDYTLANVCLVIVPVSLLCRDCLLLAPEEWH